MKAKEEKDELERLLENSEDSLTNNTVNLNSLESLEMDPLFDLDFDKIRKECELKAKKLIRNATGLMLADEMVKANPYLKNKMQVDIISLSGMFYQLEVNIEVQKVLMELIRSGAAHPRMFEVFGQLSKTIGDLNKQLLQTVEAIKITYKDIKIDIQEKNQELKAIGMGETGLMRNEKGIIALGTKELIKETKKLKMSNIENNNIKDIDNAEIVEN